MEFFDLDEQIAKIGLKAIGLTDNSTVDGGLIGFCNDSGMIGSSAVTNTYVTGILPDLYLLFYSVASFVIAAGIFSYLMYMFGPLSAYNFVLLSEILRKVVLGSIAVGCSTWILGWCIEFADALTVMFGLNMEIMTFVVNLFTGPFGCIMILIGVLGIYWTAFLYVISASIIGSLELIFIISVICWVIGAIELSICKSIAGLGDFLIRLMLWALCLKPMMALCYGIGMGIMMTSTAWNPLTIFIGLVVLFASSIVPLIIFLKYVYNPVPVVAKTAYMAARVV